MKIITTLLVLLLWAPVVEAAPDAVALLKALHKKVPYPIQRAARRVNRYVPTIATFGSGMHSGVGTRRPNGDFSVVKFGHAPEVLTKNNGSYTTWRQGQTFEGFGNPGKPALYHEVVFYAGKKTPKLLRQAGIKAKPGQTVKYQTTFLLDGSGEVKREGSVYTPDSRGGSLETVPLPVPRWMSRMAKRLKAQQQTSN